jgi:hypothetical protein
MYNVHLSWIPSQIKLTIIRGALITRERERERERERGVELEWQKRRRVEWMDGSMHSPDPMQVAIPVLLIISASPTNNTPPPHTH